MQSRVTGTPALGPLRHRLLLPIHWGSGRRASGIRFPLLQTIRKGLEVRQEEVPSEGRAGDNLRNLAQGWAFSQQTIGVPGVERRDFGSVEARLIWTARGEEKQTKLGKILLCADRCSPLGTGGTARAPQIGRGKLGVDWKTVVKAV